MRCVLALDHGGTKCEAALFRDDGMLLGWGKAQQVGSSGRSPGIGLKAARQAVDKIVFDELHVICVSGDFSVINALGIPETCRISTRYVSEHAGPFALIGEEYGIAVVAGTGARIYGKNREGREAFIDGLGPVLGDYGSGYHIGYLGLRAAVRGIFPRHATSLSEKIIEAYCRNAGGHDKDKPEVISERGCRKRGFFEERLNHPLGNRLGDMVGYSLRSHDRTVIASLSEIVGTEAAKGDAVAIGILHDAASQMAENIRDLADLLQIGNDRYVMIGIGSVATKSDVFWQHLCKLVKEFAPGIEPVLSPLPPVAGLGLLQIQQLDGVDREKARTNLFGSVREYFRRKNAEH